MNTQRIPFLGRRKHSLAPVLAGGLALGVLLIDTPGHVNSATVVLYSMVVMLVAAILSRRGTRIIAIACIVSTIVGYGAGHLDELSFPALARSLVASFTIVTAAILALRIQADSVRIEEQVLEISRAHEALDRSTAELAHATRVTMLGEMAASIAHEMTQPLSAITVHGEAGLRWLKRDVPNLDEACSAIESMVGSTRRASDVIGRIRALARKSEVTFAPFDMNSLVIETMDLLDWEVKKYGAIATLYLAPGELTIHGDRVQLQQVLINLAVNGLHAMSSVQDRPRALKIHTQLQDDMRAVVIVEDTGIGIAPERMPGLFRAFHTTKADGMGLGLSICRSIVEGHGGSITCASSPSGTRMLVGLPAVVPARQASALA
ncbi:Adaptive-response sensory-kinase SasA [Paraburkholderia sabiae]|uniref:histidine kinase n=2 Tax=Paraburkholderia sabiae TaxID=273251 RepID=A0ABU9Q9E2_9BURK|nr:Adaptive-response sensory-kinase SasA [Paraburkholderia sabiae]